MDYSYLLQNYKFDENKLDSLGIVKEGDYFILNKKLSNENLILKIKLNSSIFEIKVIDTDFDEDYLPFELPNVQNSVKNEVNQFLEELIQKAFINIDNRDILMKYMQEKYGTIYETPWSDTPEHFTFKTKYSDKWYAIIMNIKGSSLGLIYEDNINVMNIKLSEEKINSLVDNKVFFNAYHMNKKNWISIVLNRNLDLEFIKQLIDESYESVEDYSKKDNSTWLIPANPAFYNVERAFSKVNQIDWKQSAAFNVGDTIYMYVAKPIACVRFIVTVTKKDIPYDYVDENLTIKKVMKIHLEREVPKDIIDFDFLKTIGITAIRGPRKLTKIQIEQIEKRIKG